jgi:hypothetical protein
VSCDFLVVAACIYQVCRQSRVLPRFQLVTADFRRLPALLNRFSQLLYATNFLSKLSTTFKHTAASLFQLPRPLLHFRCELDRKSKFHRCAVHPSLVHTVLDAPGFENLVRCDGFVEKDFEALKCLMLFREERVVLGSSGGRAPLGGLGLPKKFRHVVSHLARLKTASNDTVSETLPYTQLCFVTAP